MPHYFKVKKNCFRYSIFRGYYTQLPSICYTPHVAEYYPKSKIFIINPLWRGDKHRITKVGKFEEAIEFIANKAHACGLNVIDGRLLTPHVPGFYSDLRLHPDDLGYGEYTRNLIPEIEKGL